MLSALFVIYGLVHIGLLVWAVRLYLSTRSVAVLMVIVPTLVLWYDCLVIGFGRFLGPSDLLQALSTIAMLVAAAVPASKFGPAPSNAGEIVLALAMVASVARFLREPAPARTSGPAAMRQAA